MPGWVCRAPGQKTRGPGHTGLWAGWTVVMSPERRPFGVWKKTWACVWARVLGARGGHGQLPPGLFRDSSVTGPAEKVTTR